MRELRPPYPKVNEFYHEIFYHGLCCAFINIVQLKEDRKLFLLSSWWHFEHVFNTSVLVVNITICGCLIPIKWHSIKLWQSKKLLFSTYWNMNSSSSSFNLTLLGNFIMMWKCSSLGKCADPIFGVEFSFNYSYYETLNVWKHHN